jgi:hypothetical protein
MGKIQTPLWEKRPKVKAVRNRNMSYAYILTSFGEKWRFKTAHCLDMNTRQTFEDLLSFRNEIHWDEMDLENFLPTKGRLVFERIAYPQTDRNDVIPSVLASEKFKNIKGIIVCVYSRSAMTHADYGKILEQVSAAVSEETEILTGWICDETTEQNSVAINLIAVCSE